MRCPDCGSSRLVKSGTRFTRKNRRGIRPKVQQYLCQTCGRQTIKPRR